ncbi:hypothetical protein QW180_19820 [Vibrio sinaloensis]|nr:hypothetical protein [Vibrio sinaloensis]
MDESAWQRHSNPLSVYSRFTIMPLLTLVLIFRDDLGWWTLPMLVSIVVWTWLNPRLFSAPKKPPIIGLQWARLANVFI